MRRPPKYDRGETIASMDDLMALYEQFSPAYEGPMLWIGAAKGATRIGVSGKVHPIHGRAEHIAWTVNRGAYSLFRMVRGGGVARAKIRQEYLDWLVNERREISKDRAA